MSAAGWVLAIVACLALRALVRAGSAPSQRTIGLVPRDPDLHTQIVALHRQEHDTFARRHTCNFDYPPPAAPIDYLAPYWPKDMPR